MQSIVAFTNSFSISAVNAVHYAGDMARALNVPLIILYAGDAENARHLNMLYDSVAEKTDNTVDIEIKKIPGASLEQVNKICLSENAALIVAAAKGYFAPKPFLPGCANAYFYNNITCPVILVRPCAQYRPVNKISFVTDLENIYSLPVNGIIQLAKAFAANVNILHVYNNENNIETIFNRIAELMNFLNKLNPQIHLVFNNDIQQGITEFAKANSSDILLSVSKNKPGIYQQDFLQTIPNEFFTPFTIS